jgi:hypothetical protein
MRLNTSIVQAVQSSNNLHSITWRCTPLKSHFLAGMHAPGAKLERGLIVRVRYSVLHADKVLLQLQLRNSTRLPSEPTQRAGHKTRSKYRSRTHLTATPLPEIKPHPRHATMASPSPTPKPGLLLVHPRLHDPTPTNATAFLRWTKLHFRDLLDMPDTGSGSVTRDLRFVAPDSDDAYTHKKEEDGAGGEITCPKYMYTCLVNNLAVLKGEAYNGVSRRLNLEKTRGLKNGEVGVEAQEEEGEEKMVFDIVDAKFAVYEEVESGSLGSGSFQNLPPHLTSRNGTAAPKSVLVAVYVDVPVGGNTDLGDVPKTLHSSLLDCVKAAVPPALKLYSSLYRWAGIESQPDLHPLINNSGRREWMILVLLVDEEGKTLVREHAVMLVNGWVKEEKGKLGAVGMEVGLWNGEVFMS